MKQNSFPAGWDEERVRQVLDYYENQSDDESVAEDENAYDISSMMEIPSELVAQVRKLLSQYKQQTISVS